MTLEKTSICNFGEKAKDFKLKNIDNKFYSLNDLKGSSGTVIMFICNHCPYVKAVTQDIVDDCKKLSSKGIKFIAIMSNDPKEYQEDSFDNMISYSKKHSFPFPYLTDETQNVAKSYGDVCTPDFFGYNKNLELQYRGRIRELQNRIPVRGCESDLEIAMKQISQTGKGPENQTPSIGCSIKWTK